MPTPIRDPQPMPPLNVRPPSGGPQPPVPVNSSPFGAPQRPMGPLPTLPGGGQSKLSGSTGNSSAGALGSSFGSPQRPSVLPPGMPTGTLPGQGLTPGQPGLPGGQPGGPVSPFTDVSTTDPFYNAIMALYGQGAMSGYGNGVFGMNDPITGAQAASVIARMYPNLGTIPLAGSNPLTRGGFAQALAGFLPGTPAYNNQFLDVPFNAPYAQAIGELAGLGITAGVGGGNYDPMGALTRGQFAQLMQNTRQHFDTLQPPPPAPAQNNPFLPGFNLGGGAGPGGARPGGGPVGPQPAQPVGGGTAQGSGFSNPFLSQLAQMGSRGSFASGSSGQRAADLTSNFMQSPFQPTNQSLAL